MIDGRCTCGDVRHRIRADSLRLYRCHCSVCRRASGGGASVATIVPRERFEWVSGEAGIASWTRPTGYRGDFCRRCGGPVPNRTGGDRYVWIPVGTLGGDVPGEVVAHLCAASRPAWDGAPLAGKVHAGAPGLEALLRDLGVEDDGGRDGSTPTR